MWYNVTYQAKKELDMLMRLKVVNSLHDIMFVAEVSDIYVSAFTEHTFPYVENAVKVEPGTGNSGENLEYTITHNGTAITYSAFVQLMNCVDI